MSWRRAALLHFGYVRTVGHSARCSTHEVAANPPILETLSGTASRCSHGSHAAYRLFEDNLTSSTYTSLVYT